MRNTTLLIVRGAIYFKQGKPPMEKIMKLKGAWFISAMTLIAYGCGGGSGSSGSGPGPIAGAAATSIFATDAPNPDFNNVWVTIYGINLVSSSGSTVSVFADTTGLTVDVRQLRDNTGQLLELLNAANIPGGTYTGAQILVSNTVTIVPKGSTTSGSYTFTTANSGGTGFTQLPVAFSPAVSASSGVPIVLDFDLANWTISGNQVSASVVLSKTATVTSTSRQVARPIQGQIQNLAGAAGSQSFSLVHDHDEILQVTANSTTTITNSDGSANPSLANAESVFLTGTLTNGVFMANSITIEKGNSDAGQTHFNGTFSNANPTAGTFTLNVQNCDNAVASTTLTVDTSATTTFFEDGVTETEANIFSLLANNPNAVLRVTGTVSGTTVSATSVRLVMPDNGGGDMHLAEAAGTASNLNATAGTLTLTVAQWQGVQLQSGSTLNVVTDSTTKYVLNGALSTEAAWFAALTSTSNVVAIGPISSGTVTAKFLAIGTGPNSGGDN